MPWILQLITGRKTSPLKTASDLRNQQPYRDADESNYNTNSLNLASELKISGTAELAVYWAKNQLEQIWLLSRHT